MNRKFFLIGATALIAALVFTACPTPTPAVVNPPGRVPHDIIVPASIPHGRITVSPAPGTKVMQNTSVSVYTYPDDDYEVDYVRMNGTDLSAAGNVYTFNMPNVDAHITAAFKESTVKTAYKIFDDGFVRSNGVDDDMVGETEWGDEGESALAGDIELENGEGMREGKAIKLAITKATNYFGLHITFDSVNLNGVDGLSLYARTTYEAEGTAYDREPVINQVVFGNYTTDSETNAGNWEYSIRYSGEENTGLLLTPQWRQIIIPLPERVNKNCDTIMLYFTPYQLEDLVFYIDQIKFIEAEEKELLSVTLPARGSIPYSKASGVVLETALDILTMDTRLLYKIDSTTNVTMFGKDGNVDVTQFLNKFTDFYTPVYSVSGGSASVVGSGNSVKIRPGSANQSGASAPRLTVVYSGKTSNAMAVDVLALTVQPSGGTLTLEDFQNLTHPNSWGGNVQLPLYWGGTAGDAQCYAYDETDAPSPDLIGVWSLRCFTANITLPPTTLSNGRPQDTWYVFGSLGLNHDLSSLSRIIVRAKLNTDIKFTFSLSSGFPGVAETLNSDGGKFSYSADFIGQGPSFQDYEIDLQQFTDNGVDLSCITGFEFFTDASINNSPAAIAGWANAGNPTLELLSVIASN